MFVNYQRPSLHCPAEVHQRRTTTATATKNNNNRNRSDSNIGSNNTENKSSSNNIGSNISWHVIFVINNYFACRHKHKQKGVGGGEKRMRERGEGGIAGKHRQTLACINSFTCSCGPNAFTSLSLSLSYSSPSAHPSSFLLLGLTRLRVRLHLPSTVCRSHSCPDEPQRC